MCGTSRARGATLRGAAVAAVSCLGAELVAPATGGLVRGAGVHASQDASLIAASQYVGDVCCWSHSWAGGILGSSCSSVHATTAVVVEVTPVIALAWPVRCPVNQAPSATVVGAGINDVALSCRA